MIISDPVINHEIRDSSHKKYLISFLKNSRSVFLLFDGDRAERAAYINILVLLYKICSFAAGIPTYISLAH